METRRWRDRWPKAPRSSHWVVDPDAETVKVYRRAGQRFAKPLLLSAADDDRLPSPLLPGLEIPLAVVFAE